MKLAERAGEKLREVRRSWPHPFWAGFKRKAWKVRLAAWPAAATLGGAGFAFATGEALPREDIRVVGILVGVLGAMAFLVIVLARTSAQMFNQLGLLLKRAGDRPGSNRDEDGDGDADAEDDLERLRKNGGVIEWRLSTLEAQDKELGKTISNMRGELLTKVDEHHALAMEFLAKKTDDIRGSLSTQVTREIGAAKDAMKQAFREVLAEHDLELAELAKGKGKGGIDGGL